MTLTSKEKDALKTALADRDLNDKAVPVLDSNPELYKDFEVAVAQVLDLFDTPVVVLPGPTGLNKAHVPVSAIFYKPAGTAYAVDAGDDIVLKYTDASGATLVTCETTGFMDQATAQPRYVRAALTAAVAPVANAPIVVHILGSEITTGTSPLRIRLYYKEVDTVL